MMTDVLTDVKNELEFNRQVLFARKQELLNEAEATQLEIDQIDIRLHTVEDIELRCKERIVSCVPAPVDKPPLKNYVDEVAEIIEKDDKPKKNTKKILIEETKKPLNGIATAIDTVNTTGDKKQLVYQLYKKNERGLPDSKNKITVSKATIDNLVNEIKKRGKIHFDDIEGINGMKYNILAYFLNDYNGSGENYRHVKYGTIPGISTTGSKKYLYWDES